MERKNTKFENVADMVKAVVDAAARQIRMGSTYYPPTTYKLWGNGNWDWVDKQAGQAFYEEKHAHGRQEPDWRTERYVIVDGRCALDSTGNRIYTEAQKLWIAKDSEIDSRKPEQVYVTTWRLQVDSHHEDIDLSEELAKQIEAIWTKRPAKYGTGMDLVGRLSLAGIVKRFEKSGYQAAGQTLAQQVSIAKAKAERNAAIRARNQARRIIKEAFAAYQAAVDKYGAAIGVSRMRVADSDVEILDTVEIEA